MNEAEQKLIDDGYSKATISESIVLHFMPSEKMELKLMAVKKNKNLKLMCTEIIMAAYEQFKEGK